MSRTESHLTRQSVDFDIELVNRARRRITLRLLPFLFLLFIVAFLDRVNVGFATLTMSPDLGFDQGVFGFGSGIFFIGYFLLEIPGTILVETWSARKWIARILITWGVIAALTGFIHNATQFYVIRFLLGAAEAGFFPGIIVYLSHWFRYEDRAKAVSLFMAAIPVSSMFGAPISGVILSHVHWLGLAGWRWLFILEGAPAVILGFMTFFYLTDWPREAKWMPDEERLWISSALEAENAEKQIVHRYNMWQALSHREVILLALGYFSMITSFYGFNFFLPTTVKQLTGYSNLVVTLIADLPFSVGLIAILLIGFSSDRTRERRWHTAGPMIIAGTGLLGCVALQSHPALALITLCITAIGMYGYLPGFWALPTSFLSGTAAAASIGLINSIGNLGGFAGPAGVGYLDRKTHSLLAGVVYLSFCALAGALFILSVRVTKNHRAGVAEGG